MNMSVKIAGVEFKNPVMEASGTFGSGMEYSEFVDLSRLGAVVTKGVANVPWPGNPTPRIAETYGGMINAIGLQNPGIDVFCERDIPFLQKYDTKIIVNVCGHSTEEYLDVLQMNIGRKCNLICKHCHVNAGPARTEEMSREVMDACLTFAKEQKIVTIDITGGAPEMNPHLEYLIEESSKICGHVIVRTNLVILLEKEYEHLMEVYARNKVEVVCSLPYYRAPEMDKVRGAGAFDKAIKVIRRLNAMGYGRNPELVLNMVYNPAGAFFPPDQEAMEKEYKQKLLQDFGIEFNSLYTLYNNPMGRFGAFLRKSGNLNRYMKKLFDAFNADTVEALMCRTQLSVDYDGQLYDCDFNLAAGMPVNGGQTIFDVTGEPYQVRKIRMDKHCYACTAGAGSS